MALSISERDLVPRARDFFVKFAIEEIAPELQRRYAEQQQARRVGKEDDIVVAVKKGHGDAPSVVTKADQSIDEKMRAAWEENLPKVLWYSEESLAEGAKTLSPAELRERPHVAVNDQVDGSGRLQRGSDRFSSSMSIVEKGKPVVGVVCKAVPETTIWVAEKGRPTVRIDKNGNVEEVHVSKTRNLEDAYIATAYAWKIKQRMRSMKIIKGRLGPYTNQFVGTASSILDTVDVAEGLIDAMAALGLFSWDQSASGLAVVGAGGRVTTKTGKDFDYHVFQEEFYASNGSIHDEMLLHINRNQLMDALAYMWRLATHKEIKRRPKEKGKFWQAARRVQETVVYLAQKTKRPTL